MKLLAGVAAASLASLAIAVWVSTREFCEFLDSLAGERE